MVDEADGSHVSGARVNRATLRQRVAYTMKKTRPMKQDEEGTMETTSGCWALPWKTNALMGIL